MTNPGQNTDASAKLDGIATDPSLSLSEKLDGIDQTLSELEGIGTDSVTAPAGSDVIGDPESATYSSAASEPIAEAPAPAPAAEQSAAVGVNGTVDYISPRDVDRDGKIDLTHSRVDGVDTITHYDTDGGITLVEQDTDYNGTYESATSVRSDGSLRTAEDHDDDGDVDLATYRDADTGLRVRQDVIEGGRIVDSRFDTNGDDNADTYLIDTDGDGRFDTANLDTDGDDITNETLVDTNGDGSFDLASADLDNNGSLESMLTANTAGDGVLGDMSTYESLIPADDSYHAQAETAPYEAPTVDEAPSSDIV